MTRRRPESLAYPAVLTIAGSDSGGGAGIQADLKAFTALSCYGTSVVTALTAQNTTGVQGIHVPPPEFVRQQLLSVLEDTDILAMKTGMLSDAPTVRIVADTLKSFYAASKTPAFVLDPVCVSTSGHTLLHEDAIEVLDSQLAPLATLITPNSAEAEAILHHRGEDLKIENVGDMIRAARRLVTRGCSAVLLKGGHVLATSDDVKDVLRDQPTIQVFREGGIRADNMEILSSVASQPVGQRAVVDVLAIRDGDTVLFVRPQVDSSSTHGTGCTLSAAITSYLAHGHELVDAVRLGCNYTHQGILHAFPIGQGHGPLNHMHGLSTRTLPMSTALDPAPLTRWMIDANAQVWKQYVEHDFVVQLGKGTLAKESFKHFIIQDHHYLRYYCRAYALLATKAQNLTSVRNAATTIQNVVAEQESHRAYCAEWGISSEDLDDAPEATACTAYGAYLIDVGVRGDYTTLLMALAACLLGYGEVGLWLQAESRKPETWVVREGNPYLKWMDEYAGENYQTAVKVGIQAIEACAVANPPSKATLEQWRKVWGRCTQFEKSFWDMGLNLST